MGPPLATSRHRDSSHRTCPRSTVALSPDSHPSPPAPARPCHAPYLGRPPWLVPALPARPEPLVDRPPCRPLDPQRRERPPCGPRVNLRLRPPRPLRQPLHRPLRLLHRPN